MTKEETFVPMKGYEGLYEVSNYGRVLSINKPITKGTGVRKPKFLKQSKGSKGYIMVKLYKDGQKLGMSIHRIVAINFIPNPSGLNVINHIDCNKTNNRVENLEWCTQRHNMTHAIENGLIAYARGEKSRKSRLTESDVLEIRQLYANAKISQMALANLFLVGQSSIWSILTRKTWNHI